jgi:hypothetical protein
MPSTYSNLKIQLMATGENTTTWGNVTNVNLGTAIEEAITGSADVTFASGNVTLTLTNTNATQIARNLRLNLTGTTGGSARNLVVPAIEKAYLVNNGCADAVTVKNATGTGIAVPAGKTMWVYNDGTNVVDATTHLTSLTLASALPVASGGTGANTAANARVNLLPAYAGNANRALVLNSGATDTEWTAVGTVTSVNASGSTTGLTFTGGPITGSGTLTLGGTLGVSAGGTGATTASGARTNIGATTVGGNFFTLTNPSAITFIRVNSDNSVSALSASDFRTAIGVGTGTGTVISVDVSGGSTGLTFTGGPVTSSGTITAGGTLAVANGGTGAATAANARVNLLPSYSGNAGRVLAVTAGGTDVEWIAAGGSGTVTSVSGTGTVNGITLTGTVTASGSLTLGGTLSGVSLTTQVTGTLPVANGGTGATTHTSNAVLIGNGTSAVTSVSPGTSGNVLSSNGTAWISQVPSGTFGLSDGSASAPSLFFTNDTNTGIYNIGTNQLGISTDGINRIEIKPSETQFNNAVRASNTLILNTTGSMAAPASASASGTAGEIRIDTSYIYVCTATNTWKRVAIATWP